MAADLPWWQASRARRVGAPTQFIREDDQFWDRLHTCVWGSETADDFESQWNSIITDFALMGNDWFSTKFAMRQSWIPAYFMDIPLAGILRTMSRSESANSFF